MKYLESSFDDYIQSSKKSNLHNKYTKIYSLFSTNFKKGKNVIFYGPTGIGKYTQGLKFIEKYSPSKLKYEKRFNIRFSKKRSYLFRMSDIHYEIDMSLLGCNSRLLWNAIYKQIIDIINTKPIKQGIILCKNFHKIHSELLDVFYNFMQNFNSIIQLKFILITEQISFIPQHILNTCDIISFGRPSKNAYVKCIKPIKFNKNIKLHTITNIKNLKKSITQLREPYEIICNQIIQLMINNDSSNLLVLRENLYNILIFQLDVGECIWYLLNELIKIYPLSEQNISIINVEILRFFKYFNNNYRPIYHLERIVLYISSVIHGI